ncbi:MAG: TVP38/TMEM64 family protein [Rhizobiales bacterium]|nr:TVP38/TMEM64 family protein [Hyphomicrobiales bacterium]
MAHPRRWLLIVVVTLVLAGVAATVWGFTLGLTAEALAAWIDGLGIWAPIGFVVLYAVATVALVPGGIFDLVGGALFGPYLGSAINLLGGTLGAALAFLFARYIARDWAQVRAGPRLQGIMRSVDEEDWRFVAFVRLVPVIPYNITNYLLGVTRIPFPRYVLATLVFMAPSTVAYTWIGHASRQAIAGDTENIKYALLALALIALVLLVPRFYKRIRSS